MTNEEIAAAKTLLLLTTARLHDVFLTKTSTQWWIRTADMSMHTFHANSLERFQKNLARICGEQNDQP